MQVGKSLYYCHADTQILKKVPSLPENLKKIKLTDLRKDAGCPGMLLCCNSFSCLPSSYVAVDKRKNLP